MADPKAKAFYEFRCWPRQYVPAIGQLHRDWRPAASESRQDVYLLPMQPQNYLTKLRDGYELEIKELLDHRERFELWDAVLAQRFPLTMPTLRDLSQALGMPQTLDKEDGASPAHLMRALSERSPALALIRVKKARAQFERRPIRAEITHVTTPYISTISVAVEAADVSLLRAAVQDLGLTGYANCDYGAFLREEVLSHMLDHRGAA